MIEVSPILYTALIISCINSFSIYKLYQVSRYRVLKTYIMLQLLAMVVILFSLLGESSKNLGSTGEYVSLTGRMLFLMILPDLTRLVLRMQGAETIRLPGVFRVYRGLVPVAYILVIGSLIVQDVSAEIYAFYKGFLFLLMLGLYHLMLNLWSVIRNFRGEKPLLRDRLSHLLVALTTTFGFGLAFLPFAEKAVPGFNFAGISNSEAIALGILLLQIIASRVNSLWMKSEFKTKRDTAEQLSAYQSSYRDIVYRDRVTSQGNMTAMLEMLRARMKSADQKPFSLILITIDNYTDMLLVRGLHQGNQILRSVADRIEEGFGKHNSLFRLYNNRFALVCESPMSQDEIGQCSSLLLQDCESGISLDDASETSITLSMGIVSLPGDGISATKARENCLVALKEAQKSGNKYVFFNEDMAGKIRESYSIYQAVRETVRDDKFRVVYQPIVNREKQVIKAEALIRSQHPLLASISPEIWIPVAEKTGLIGPISIQVWKKSLIAARVLKHQGLDIAVTINVSPKAIEHKPFRNLVLNNLNKTVIREKRIKIEITETALMEGKGIVLDFINKVRTAGIEILLDDFGTGYSSLAYLQKLPLDTIKLDRTFIQDINEIDEDRILCSTILELVNKLGKGSVAEGVETEESFEKLREMGCVSFQGWHFGRPVPLEDFLSLYGNPGRRAA